MNELDLFAAAIAVDDPRERDALLKRECAGRPELRLRLDRLLVEHLRPDPRLDRPGFDPTAVLPATEAGDAGGTVQYEQAGGATMDRTVSDRPRDHSTPGIIVQGDRGEDERAGAVIAGKYTLVEVVGEGGMGSVWRARQTEPVRRFVAVKLIKAGMDSRQVLARFDAERQALALMDHPNIAKVLDGGLHEGRPYFVMELVKGIPITEYCDQRRLTPKERLELFVPACQAIQHSHQKGIIHRDIKPSNVLIALYDDRPVVKVIDFGVAKATGGALTEHTIDTGFGGVVGTPQYMSPEQATFNNLDVDTRSDVYALGVLLYELLTGSPPFSRDELEKRGVLEMLRVVREEEPPRPSTRLSTADALPTLSANRGTEPHKLTGLLRNELDWVVMKALEKDRSRRYETANGFAADVQRYLAGEAVLAHPPGAAYRLRKFARRNRVQVIAATVVLAALMAGVVGTTVSLVRERRAKQEAERNLAFASKGNDILGSVFAGLDPKAEYATVAELRNALRDNLAQAVRELEGSAVGDPLEVAAMQNRLGLSLLGLGEADLAVDVLGKALATRKTRLGAEHSDTLDCMGSLALGYRDAGRLDRALPLMEETLRLRTAKLGADHPSTLSDMGNLSLGYRDAGEPYRALPLMEEALRRCTARMGADHPDTLSAMGNLASGYRDAGDLARALPLFEETLRLRTAKLGADHPSTLESMNNLANGYKKVGKPDRALPLMEETLRRATTRLGADHPHTLSAMNNLASGYKDAGKPDRALPLLEETLRLRTAKLGADHPDTLIAMSNLASGYWDAGKPDRALPLQEEELRLSTSKLGADHPDTLITMGNLALSYLDTGKPDRALPLMEQALERMTRKLGADHPSTLTAMVNLAGGYQRAGKPDRALPLMEQALKAKTAKLGADHPDTVESMSRLAGLYRSLKRYDKSIPMYEALLQLQAGKLGRDHGDTLTTIASLGTNHTEAGRPDAAIPLLEDAYTHVSLRWVSIPLLEAYVGAGRTARCDELSARIVEDVHKSLPEGSPARAGILIQISMLLLKYRNFAAAEPLLRESLAFWEKKDPDNWLTFTLRSTLGGALLGLKKPAEAEPLLLSGYEGLKAHEATIPRSDGAEVVLPDALDRLIELYTATKKPDELKKWQAERAKYPAAKPEGKK